MAVMSRLMFASAAIIIGLAGCGGERSESKPASSPSDVEVEFDDDSDFVEEEASETEATPEEEEPIEEESAEAEAPAEPEASAEESLLPSTPVAPPIAEPEAGLLDPDEPPRRDDPLAPFEEEEDPEEPDIDPLDL